jgi:hypothetical protein
MTEQTPRYGPQPTKDLVWLYSEIQRIKLQVAQLADVVQDMIKEASTRESSLNTVLASLEHLPPIQDSPEAPPR